MRHQYKRERSEFWITVHENGNDSYTITTPEKYIRIINYFFPLLKEVSPKGWSESCFSNELDFCIASDFNFYYGADRTEMGEAEYNLKYNVRNLEPEQETEYMDFIIGRMLECARYIPMREGEKWVISPMPSTQEGRGKLAWRLAMNLSEALEVKFVEPFFLCNKPEMKSLTIAEKVNVWNEIYNSGNVTVEGDIMKKNVIIIDDLYQSGTTMWQYARFLKGLGAKSVWGLVCVKSLKDSDNR